MFQEFPTRYLLVNANLMDKLKVSNNVELAHRMLDSW